MTLRSHRRRRGGRRLGAFFSITTTALVVARGWCAPVLAAHPVAGPTSYGVRPGSPILVCGGFDGHCETSQLAGAIEIQPGYHGHLPGEDVPASIVSSALELISPNGHATPFPAPNDLPLTALEGSSDGAVLRFVSPVQSAQTVELVLTPFSDGAGTTGGYMLSGFYDEGCCDRFRMELGNVVLRPERIADALELQHGRFRATATWRASSGRQGVGSPVAIDDASGFFWFFTTNNPEVFVKVLDACALNNRYWVFAGGLTNLGVQITISDQRSDLALPIINPLGSNFATFIDTSSFACETPVP